MFTYGDHYGPLEKQVSLHCRRRSPSFRCPSECAEQVFDLWTDLDRAHEWIEGLTRITDVTGPITTAGTRYSAWFGRMRSPSEILQVDRPTLVRTRFGSWLLRGVEQATFVDQGHGTRLTREFWTNGIISAIMGRIFAYGSYKGSFRGELKSFARLAEREAGTPKVLNGKRPVVACWTLDSLRRDRGSLRVYRRMFVSRRRNPTPS